MERSIITAFVASPSDLADERRILRDVVERLNKIYGRRVGLQIELLGWEDTLPGFSRPQALINKDVENCDLFIGMLWKRWGSDSGEYSSGFEEEFTIARKRKLDSNKPEIWLFFKNVDDEFQEDPGEQLKKTLNFKRRQIESKELLFKNVEDKSQFRDIVYDNLSSYILDIYNASKAESELGVQGASVRSFDEGEIARKEESSEANTQLLEVYSKLGTCCKSGTENDISYWERVRAYLSTSALFSQSHLGELFGVHEINLVYRKRRLWKLAFHEEWYLIRSYFGHSSKVVPGWYWLRNKDESSITELLLYLAKNDRNNEVRKGALNTLIKKSTPLHINQINDLLREENVDILLSAIQLAGKTHDKKLLDALEPLLEHPNEKVRKQALCEYIDTLYAFDPEESFKVMTKKSTSVTETYGRSLETLDLKVGTDLMVFAISEGNPRIREFSAKYLQKTGSLTREIAELLLKDTDSHVRRIGFEWLMDNGMEFNIGDISKLFPRPQKVGGLLGLGRKEVTEDDIIPMVFSMKSKKELEEMVDFYSLPGREAYEALVCNHTSDVIERVRDDLEDEFKSIMNRSENKLRAMYGDAASSTIAAYKSDLFDFVRDSFVTSAMKGLATSAIKSDIKYARKYLGKTKYGLADQSAIAIIEKYGNVNDVEQLIGVAKSKYGTTKEMAIDVAIKMSAEKKAIIDRLVSDNDKSISELAAKHIAILDREEKIKMAKAFLDSENETVRLEGAKTIIHQLGKNEVESILNEYIENEIYYYNVVNLFDGFLYAEEFYEKKVGQSFH